MLPDRILFRLHSSFTAPAPWLIADWYADAYATGLDAGWPWEASPGLPTSLLPAASTSRVIATSGASLPADPGPIAAIPGAIGATETSAAVSASGGTASVAQGVVSATLPAAQGGVTLPAAQGGVTLPAAPGGMTLHDSVTGQIGTAASTSVAITVDPGPIVAWKAAASTGPAAVLAFDALDAAGRRELWITNASPASTAELAVAGAASGGLDPTDLTTLGSEILFSGIDASGQASLWASNGTAAGTSELAAGAAPTDIMAWGTLALFAGGDGGLWVTNATVSGTREIAASGAGASGLDPHGFTALNQVTLFAATDVAGHVGLWVTNGTAPGTRELTVSGAAASGLNPTGLTLFANRIFFAGTDAGGRIGLWSTDATGAAAIELAVSGAAATGLNPTGFAVLNNRLVFAGTDAAGRVGLWSSDGTGAGTAEILLAGQALRNPTDLVVFNSANGALFGGRALFAATDASGRSELWVTDGTASGTSELLVAGADASGLDPTNLQVLGGRVLFSGLDALGRRSLWWSDGTAAGTYEVPENTAQNVGAALLSPIAIANAAVTVTLLAQLDAKGDPEPVIGRGLSEILASVTPGLVGDTLTLHTSGLVAGASLVLVSGAGGTSNVVYTAPASLPAGGTWDDTVSFTVSDQAGDVSAATTATVLLDPGPQVAAGTLHATALGAYNLTALIQSLSHIGMSGDLDTISAAVATSGQIRISGGQVEYFAPLSGTDTITFTITDQYGASAHAAIAVGNVGANGSPAVISGNGNLVATAWAATIIESGAGLGNVQLVALGADETIIDRNSGNTDLITASGTASRIMAGGGNNVIAVGGASTVVAGDGNNTIAIGSYADTIILGAGANIVSGGPGDTTIEAGNGNDTIRLGGAFNVIQLGSGLQNVSAGSGADIILMGDSVGGTSTLIAGGGNDQVIGGAGNMLVDIGGGGATIELGAGAHTLVLGGADNLITLGAGNATIIGSGGASTMSIGDGALTLDVSGANSSYRLGDGMHVIEAGGDANDAWNMGDGTLAMSGIGANDSITAGLGDTLINAVIAATAADCNIRIVDDGAYNIAIGQGSTLEVGNAVGATGTLAALGAGVAISGGDGNFLVSGLAGASSLLLGNGNDSVAANGSANTITLGSGNAVVSGNYAASTLTLGAGNDSFATLTGSANLITIGAGNQILYLGAQAESETITLADGTDQVSGGGGYETLTIGTGLVTDNETVTLQGADNLVTLHDIGVDVVNLGSIGVGTLVLAGVTAGGASSITGAGGEDRITGGAGNYLVTLAGGSNTLSLGAGNDTLAVSSQFDSIVLGAGNDVLNFTASDGESVAIGAGNETVALSGGFNTLSLGAGISSVNANGGAFDRISAGDGSLAITNGGSNDVVSMGGAGGIANLTATLGDQATLTMLDSGLLSLTIGIEASLVLGNSVGGTSIISTGGAWQSISGGNGAFSVTGLGDQSVLSLGNGTDTVGIVGINEAITLGTGTDSVIGGTGGETVQLGNGTNTVAIGGAYDTVDAGTGSNTIAATGGWAAILTAGGRASITVGGSNNTIDVGAGTATTHDLVTASTGGSDTIVLNGTGQGLVEITNFLAATDILDIHRTLAGLNLSHGLAATITSTQVAGNTLLWVNQTASGVIGSGINFAQLDGVATSAAQLIQNSNFRT